MPDFKSLSDVALINLLKASDQAAFTEIFNRYFNLMFLHAFKKLRDEKQAEDIVQELFALLWLKRTDLAASTNLGGYLYTAIRNKIIDGYLHQKVEAKHLVSLQAYAANYTYATTDHRIREQQLQKYIDKEIQALPSKMRMIFELSRRDHLSHREIAHTLNTSEFNVSKQITNALKILKSKLGVIGLMV